MLRLTPFGPNLVALASLLCPACSRPLSADECNQLLSHYTELVARSEHQGISDEEVARMEQEARAKAAADREFSRCSAKVSRAQFECAMKAPTVDDVERCLL